MTTPSQCFSLLHEKPKQTSEAECWNNAIAMQSRPLGNEVVMVSALRDFLKYGGDALTYATRRTM